MDVAIAFGPWNGPREPAGVLMSPDQQGKIT